MTVTSISGNIKASEDVTIHNKDYREDSYSRSFATPGYDVTDSVTIPYMDTYRSPSESSLTSGFDERSIDSIFDAPLRSMEAAYQETRDATETPVPDLEEIDRWEPQAQSRVHVSEEEKEEKEEEKEETEMKSPVEELKKNPFTLHKKPVVPELKYRWQYGYRRGIGSTYQKVPILKLELKYSESTPLLPSTLSIETKTESRLLPVGPTGAVAEFVFKDGDAQTIHISARDKSGLEHISSPSFRCTPGSLDQPCITL
ncbi:uncharacterized protein LOC111715849 isoform X2 [Eurytemora carolleeae]|uniref:uncharacterized protein LOC111715849 isoform X2 n=1 Tax=Eurytemora carolleeae TaxID=1294199 RepID=UPI000C75765E|nr:uncharacterized protein LOC111715849 isoform X2 [Eurytemora carolleeae]|eukprot:XP_023347007.1 uncharacterized protein LOC111715849 isoform X2 [Eurytemora affinis]